MKITYDQDKRDKTLLERGLDFEDAYYVFENKHITQPDDRKDYGEARYFTFGILESRFVVIIWTPRNTTRRVISIVISMRYANEKEITHLSPKLNS